MIYLTGAGGAFRVIVLDTRDIDNLKSPHPWMAPDRSALVAFTPDPDWLLSRIRMGPGTPQDIARAIDEAARRPQAELAVTPILGANAKSLARAIRARGRLDPVVAGPAKALPQILGDVLQDGDLLLMMGAGDIGAVANELAASGLTLEHKA